MCDDVRDDEFIFDGKIVSIQKGVPIKVSVRVARPCRNGAFIKSNLLLKAGEKIGIVIFGLNSEEFELLRYSDQPDSVPTALRTQAVVINKTGPDQCSPDFIMKIGFVGNFHFDDATEPADVMQF